jgi:transposase InsO family protein
VKSCFHGVPKKFCDEIIGRCAECKVAKPVVGSPHVTPIESKAPHERIVVDLKDFSAYLPKEGAPGYDPEQKRYLMVIVDHYSGFVVTYALSRKTADAVWAKMLKFLKSVGIPEIIHSDNGGEFVLCVLSLESISCPFSV